MNTPFESLARQVIQRLTFARWMRLLVASAPYVFIAASILLLFDRFAATYWLGWPALMAVTGLWFGAALAWAWWQRPSAIAALAYWDERTGRNEMFASALWFERQPSRDAGATLHLETARARLASDSAHLRRDLPLGFAHRVWLTPVVLLVLSLLLVQPAPAPEARVAEGDRENAREVATEINKRTRLEDKRQQLNQEEKEKLKKLEDSLDKTADKLKQLDNETRREVLAELEQRVDEAEQLSSSLAGRDDKLSSAMLAELERHVDTTDFAAAHRAESLEKMAEESTRLGKQLERTEVTLEEQKRIEEALDAALGAANDSDKKTLAGKHLKKSLEELQKKEPAKAGEQFDKLAQEYQKSLQRQQLQKQLEQLAKQLRNSGQQIFGQNQTQVRRLAQSQPSPGLRQLGSQQLQNMQMSLQQSSAQGQPTQVAQAGQLQPNQGQPMGVVPGTNPSSTPPGAAPGSNPGQSPPIPGTSPPGSPSGSNPSNNPGNGQVPGSGQMPGSGQAPGSGQSPGSGSTPVPGTGQGGQPGAAQSGGQASAPGAGIGGHQAGSGSVALSPMPTTPMTPTELIKANSQMGKEGPSQVRNINGQQHREETARNKKELAAEFLRAQEEALADEPLPISRRDQVLRYFTALRRQLVDEPKVDAPKVDEPKSP